MSNLKKLEFRTWRGIPSVYDTTSLSYVEQLASVIEAVNSVIDYVDAFKESQNDYTDEQIKIVNGLIASEIERVTSMINDVINNTDMLINDVYTALSESKHELLLELQRQTNILNNTIRDMYRRVTVEYIIADNNILRVLEAEVSRLEGLIDEIIHQPILDPSTIEVDKASVEIVVRNIWNRLCHYGGMTPREIRVAHINCDELTEMKIPAKDVAMHMADYVKPLWKLYQSPVDMVFKELQFVLNDLGNIAKDGMICDTLTAKNIICDNFTNANILVRDINFRGNTVLEGIQ